VLPPERKFRALLVIDTQLSFLEGPYAIQSPPREESLAKILQAIATAELDGIPIALIQLDSQETEFGGDSPKSSDPLVDDETSLHPAVLAQQSYHWKSIIQGANGAFQNKELLEWLDTLGVNVITLVGHLTHGAVALTAVQAMALGYPVEVLADATGTHAISNAQGTVTAADLQLVSLTILEHIGAEVTTTANWITEVENAAASEYVRNLQKEGRP
jgi:nicotinamidase-related amidase